MPAGRQGGFVDLCIATPRFHPVYAGPAIRFRRYAPGFRARGIRPRVFSALWGDEEQAEDPAIVVDGIPIARVRLRRTVRGLDVARFDRALARHVRDRPPAVLQLLHLNPFSIPWLWAIRRRRIPLVYTLTMMRSPDLDRWKNRLWLAPFRMLDRVVVSSGVMRDNARTIGVRAPIEVIPNGVDVERFRPLRSAGERRALRRSLDLAPDTEVIAFVGGYLHHRKGVDVLADAWIDVARRRPRALLLLVGPTRNPFTEEEPQRRFLERVRDSLERSGAPDRVVFTGPVDDVERYLQASDVFVFPSRREGMPNVVAEAFSCGLPCILAPFVGLPEEFGRPGREYELVQRTPEDLAGAIHRLLDDPDRRRELGSAARRWAAEELSLERSQDLYAALYRDLAAENGHRRKAR